MFEYVFLNAQQNQGRIEGQEKKEIHKQTIWHCRINWHHFPKGIIPGRKNKTKMFLSSYDNSVMLLENHAQAVKILPRIIFSLHIQNFTYFFFQSCHIDLLKLNYRVRFLIFSYGPYTVNNKQRVFRSAVMKTYTLSSSTRWKRLLLYRLKAQTWTQIKFHMSSPLGSNLSQSNPFCPSEHAQWNSGVDLVERSNFGLLNLKAKLKRLHERSFSLFSDAHVWDAWGRKLGFTATSQ